MQFKVISDRLLSEFSKNVLSIFTRNSNIPNSLPHPSPLSFRYIEDCYPELYDVGILLGHSVIWSLVDITSGRTINMSGSITIYEARMVSGRRHKTSKMAFKIRSSLSSCDPRVAAKFYVYHIDMNFYGYFLWGWTSLDFWWWQPHRINRFASLYRFKKDVWVSASDYLLHWHLGFLYQTSWLEF